MSGDFSDPTRHIDQIYRAAVAPENWPVLLESLREELRAKTIHLLVRHPTDGVRGIDISLGVDEATTEAYYSYFHRISPWLPHIVAEREGEIRAYQSYLSEAELLKTEYYNDWMRPQGILHGLGGSIRKSGGQELFSSFGSFREKGQGPFEREELDRIRPLIPHLQRALAIHRRLKEAELRASAAGDALERIPGGVILLDERGAPIVTNRSADEILSESDGLFLDRSGPRAALAEETRELQRLIAEAAMTGAGQGSEPGAALRLTRPSGRAALELVVTPIRRESTPLLDRRASAAIFVTDPDSRSECSPKRLRQLFGLTAMEARVASRIVRGVRLPEIAEELGVTIHTVRDHLKHAFRRTGTHRQVDLVRVLLTGPASLLPD